MDVSPKTLREVEFREKMRGYHPEDVDQFLERVAAGIEVLQDRLRQALERAQKAEAQLAESGGADDTLRRTLVLAQRTADLAVQEAREQAARILAGAEQQAQAMITGAEEEVRRAHDQTLVDVEAEITRLQVDRDRLQLDIETLTAWVGEHRTRLAAALQSALAVIEGADLPPAPSVTTGPEDAGAAAGGAAGPGSADPRPGADPDSGVAGPGPTAGGRPAGEPVPAGDPSGPQAADARTASAPGTAWAGAPAPGPAGSGDPGGDPAGASGPAGVARASGADPANGADGPDTMAWYPGEDSGGAPVVRHDDDPYFAQLRQAVNDREPLGPRDHDDQEAAPVPLVPTAASGDAFFDQDVADTRRPGGKLRWRR